MKMEADSIWLFDYDQGMAYERFSQCEDADGVITQCLSARFDFSNKAILEIGAGSGKFTDFLAEHATSLAVVERSASLIAINESKNRNRADFINSDLGKLDFDADSFDVVFGGWSLTSMRDMFGRVFPILQNAMKKDGQIIIVENAGNDEFTKIAGIEELTSQMRNFYAECGFKEEAVLDTVIRLPNQETFFDAFPNLKAQGIKLPSLEISHKVVIMRASASDFRLEE